MCNMGITSTQQKLTQTEGLCYQLLFDNGVPRAVSWDTIPFTLSSGASGGGAKDRGES